jgi:hypothetical protein
MKHGTVSSKRRGVQKAELGIASPHSSLNLGCSRTVGGPFGTWLGPFRDLVGALSGLGWGPFGTWLGCFRTVLLGCFQKHTGEKEKTTSEKCKASTACTLFLSGWSRAHKKGACCTEMKHAIRYRANKRGRSPRRASQQNK